MTECRHMWYLNSLGPYSNPFFDKPLQKYTFLCNNSSFCFHWKQNNPKCFAVCLSRRDLVFISGKEYGHTHTVKKIGINLPLIKGESRGVGGGESI